MKIKNLLKSLFSPRRKGTVVLDQKRGWVHTPF